MTPVENQRAIHAVQRVSCSQCILTSRSYWYGPTGFLGWQLSVFRYGHHSFYRRRTSLFRGAAVRGWRQLYRQYLNVRGCSPLSAAALAAEDHGAIGKGPPAAGVQRTQRIREKQL